MKRKREEKNTSGKEWEKKRKMDLLQSFAGMDVHLKFNERIPDEPTSLACPCAIVRESRRIAAIIHGE